MTFLFLLPYQLRIAHACPVDVLRPTHHRDMLGAPASRFSCRSVLALAVFEVRVSPAGPRACGSTRNVHAKRLKRARDQRYSFFDLARHRVACLRAVGGSQALR